MNKNIFVAIICIAIFAISEKGIAEEMNAESRKKECITEQIEYLKVYGESREVFKNGKLDVEVNFYISVPKNASLLEKLEILADKLSRFKFSYLPIEILGIKENNNKKIASINLQDPKQADSIKRWISSYFGGSTQGTCTANTLRRSFLQEDYKGQWVDGVEFYYNGEPIGLLRILI